MTDLELWHLRALVAVADTGTFTAAAQRLAVSQPAVSRAIAALEKTVGGRVLDRSTHHCETTPVGRVLLARARPLLEGVNAASTAARLMTGREGRTVVLALKAESDGGLLPDILARCRNRDADLQVELLFLGPHELTSAVRDGRADAALVVGPANLVDDGEVEVEELWSESRVVVLPEGHPLAARAGLVLADLDSVPIIRWPALPDAFERYYRGMEGASSVAAPDGPPATTLADALRLIELDRGVTFLPESAARRFAGMRIACRPVRDLGRSGTRLVWRRESRDPAVAVIASAATDVAARRHVDQHDPTGGPVS